MEPDSGDSKSTTEDLERKKLELEIEQLQKEARVPRFLRPGYLGSLLAVIIPVVSYLYLDQSGFFERERRILELQKEELRADVRSFEGEKERLTEEVAALRDKEVVLTERLDSTQGQYETQVANLQRYSVDLGKMQWEYLNKVIEEVKLMKMVAVGAKEFAKTTEDIEERERRSDKAREKLHSCLDNLDINLLDDDLTTRLDKHLDCHDQWLVDRPQEESIIEETPAELKQISLARMDSLDNYAEDCRTNHLGFTKSNFPLSSKALDHAVEEIKDCIYTWTPPSVNETKAGGSEQ